MMCGCLTCGVGHEVFLYVRVVMIGDDGRVEMGEL